MKFIAHRGNTTKCCKESENDPEYILEAIRKGFDVEIDVWYDKGLYLGHDYKQYKIKESFIRDNNKDLWCHAKNAASITILRKLDVNYFWHDKDKYTIASNGEIWNYPTANPIDNCIINQPEWIFGDNVECIVDYLKENNASGVCSDIIKQIKVKCD